MTTQSSFTSDELALLHTMRNKLGFGWDSKSEVETAERLMVARFKRNIFITAAIFIVLAFPVIFFIGAVASVENDMASLGFGDMVGQASSYAYLYYGITFLIMAGIAAPIILSFVKKMKTAKSLCRKRLAELH